MSSVNRSGGSLVGQLNMLATNDLYRFTDARASNPWLLDFAWSEFPRRPQVRGNLQLPDRLLGQDDLIAALELLGGQCAPEIGVLGPQNAQNMLYQRRFKAPVPGPVPAPRDQSNRDFGPIPDHRPLDRPYRQLQPFRGPAASDPHR